ncbi:MAG: tetratricopeptide repeat protein [Gemmatimonadetes bacterium]|jgi:protein O-GlcNAc transferase|nr:tetratricopeptide repeat protein [Gemmatimonadota bacterium]
MMRFFLLWALCLLCWGVGQGEGQARKAYNIWAKEKVRYLQSKVTRSPYDPQLRVLLAKAFYEDGKKFKAREQLQEALELEPDFAEAHCNLAVIFHGQGMAGEARQHFEAALRQDSTMIEAMAGLGTLLCAIEQQAEGLEYLEKVATLDPQRTRARYNMAVAYHKIGDFKKAVEHLEALLAVDANYSGARRGLARAYYSLTLRRLQAKQPELALESIDRALVYEREDGNLFFAKGLAHLGQRQYDRAEVAFKEVVALEEDHVPALHNLGTVCERLGRLQEAAHYYERVRALTPHLATIEAVKHATYDVEYLVE